MIVALTGSNYPDADFIREQLIESGFEPTEIVTTVEWWPGELNRLPYDRMVKRVDTLVAVWDGKNRRTQHLIDLAKQNGKPVYSVIRRIYRRNNGY